MGINWSGAEQHDQEPDQKDSDQNFQELRFFILHSHLQQHILFPDRNDNDSAESIFAQESEQKHCDQKF